MSRRKSGPEGKALPAPQRGCEPARSRERSRTGRVRIQDVADCAGVSAMTVSRALHRPELLSPELLDRVLEAVQAVGYTPDLAASSLASNRTGIVAVIVPTLANAVFSE